MSILKRVVLSTLVSIVIVFSLSIALAVNVLRNNSINTAKNMYDYHAYYIAKAIETSINIETNFLNI